MDGWLIPSPARSFWKWLRAFFMFHFVRLLRNDVKNSLTTSESCTLRLVYPLGFYPLSVSNITVGDNKVMFTQSPASYVLKVLGLFQTVCKDEFPNCYVEQTVWCVRVVASCCDTSLLALPGSHWSLAGAHLMVSPWSSNIKLCGSLTKVSCWLWSLVDHIEAVSGKACDVQTWRKRRSSGVTSHTTTDLSSAACRLAFLINFFLPY